MDCAEIKRTTVPRVHRVARLQPLDCHPGRAPPGSRVRGQAPGARAGTMSPGVTVNERPSFNLELGGTCVRLASLGASRRFGVRDDTWRNCETITRQPRSLS